MRILICVSLFVSISITFAIRQNSGLCYAIAMNRLKVVGQYCTIVD